MYRIEASECLRNLATIERRVLDAARLGMDEVVKVAYRNAKATTLFRDRTGELRGTLDIVDQGAYRKRLSAPAKHAIFIVGGTKAHEIRPRKATRGFIGPLKKGQSRRAGARMLRFVIGNRVVFARRVWHPGTTKRPFMWNAAMAGAQTMLVGLNDRVEKAVDYP